MSSTEPAPREQRAIDELVTRALAALPDVHAARGVLDELAREDGDRAVFALCLLTLELARAGDGRAREELPGHVEVLMAAWRDPALSLLLTAGNPELVSRWELVRPIVGEFVEQQGTAPRCPTPGPAPRLATPTELMVDVQEILEEEPAAPRAPPAPPAEALDEIQEFEVEPEPAPAAAPAPPPPPAAALASRPPPAPALAPPAPPPAMAQPETDEQTRLFWRFAEEALGRLPSPDENMLGTRSFGAEKADRTRLVRFAHSTLARFPRCEHARGLASLVLLYVASQEKERGLLGVNRERLDAIRTALSLLGDAGAAASAAVLFENDGSATRKRFAGVVELMSSFLGFCLREGLDPRLPETQARFCAPT